jgi:hypothetical protein
MNRPEGADIRQVRARFRSSQAPIARVGWAYLLTAFHPDRQKLPTSSRAPRNIIHGQQNAHRRHPCGRNPRGGGSRHRIEEFDFESAARKQLKGNIYLAKVTRVEPSLQAAFIDYGGNRHGFLAFSEIHPDYYQIPVADRQALIRAEEEEAQRHAEEESRSQGKGESENDEADSTSEAGERSGSENGANSDSENGGAALDGAPTGAHGLSADIGQGVETVDTRSRKSSSAGR